MYSYNIESVLQNYLDKGAGKLTKQRKIIIDILVKAKSHLTIEEIFKITKEKYPGIGVATVYRTVKLLCECGLASGFKHIDGTVRYEIEQEYHNHLVCIKCGRLVEDSDFKVEVFQNTLAQKHKFKILITRMDLFGICDACC